MLSGLRALLIDLDGTVYNDDQLIAGAGETIAELRRRGYSCCFVTNTTNKRRATIKRKLECWGMEVDEAHVFTAPFAASLMLQSYPQSKCWILTRGDAVDEFQKLRLSEMSPDFIVLGDLMEGFTVELLNRIFRKILAGAQLIALQKNRYWLTGGKLTLDMGPFVAALEYATGRRASIIGKPSREFFQLAVSYLQVAPHEIAMVGDDVEVDIAGAREAGLRTILVQTGKYRPEDLEKMKVKPDGVIESLADLGDFLP